MSSVNAIRKILERLGFSEAVATYLTGTCGIDSLDEILLSTIQMRLHDVIVNETPKLQSFNPTKL
jgi:hypothetical protein